METLWSTLHSITTIKRQELAKQRDACRALRSDLLGPLDSESDERERVRLLLKKAGKRLHRLEDGVLRHRKQRVADIGVEKESSQHDEILALAGLSSLNIQRFLQQSEYDTSIPAAFFTTTEEKFRRALRALEIKYDYATLFSDLVTERSQEHLEATSSSSETADFESVGRQELHDQRREWESLAFTPSDVDVDDVLSALEKTFDTPEAAQSLESFRKACGQVCHRIQHDKIRGSYEMKMLVDGLIASDLLADSQTAVLKQARNSDTWLCEMADVLNLRLASIERWTWETDAVPLEMRRQLNGKHRVYMLEEISQALLIYHVGISFASSFGQLFDNFYRSAGWKEHSGVGRADQARWDYFVGKRANTRRRGGGIVDKLSAKFHEDFFLSVLPRRKEEGEGGYGDDSLTDGEMQSRVAKAVATKHSLLHLLVAEGLLADRLGEELVVVQTDFRWFGPSLSHATIEAVMHFLGVTKVWKDFFLSFLCAPLRFQMDGPQGAVKTRERGVPMSHVLSSLFGEAALFCLDFAVNEATKGKPMFRMHDDVYLWGTAEEMEVAWQALTTLASTMGITLNEKKSGTARLTGGTSKQSATNSAIPSSLPVGPLQWGLLTTKSSGNRFAIDQSSIDEHIVELKRQLESRKSVLAWIKAYNTYMDFFKLHMGKTSNAMGQAHVDDCLTTIHRINVALCPSTNGNVAAYVKKMISDRFAVEDIPDGFLFFPMICGGLELRNPIISLQALRDNVLEDPAEIVDQALEDEQVEYNRLKKIFDKDGPSDKHAMSDSKPTTFPDADEFAVFRREYNPFFLDAWTELLGQVEEEMVEKTAEMDSYLPKLSSGEGGYALATQSTQPYWRAVVELYGPEMCETFGGLQVVERDLLPMGMVDLLKGKVRWDA